MPTNSRHSRAINTVPAAWKREPVVTIEQALRADSSLVASPDEVEEQERQHADRLARETAHLDNVLAAMWSCRACGVGNAMGGSSSGLCGPCTNVAALIKAEQRVSQMTSTVAARRELVLNFWRDNHDAARVCHLQWPRPVFMPPSPPPKMLSLSNTFSSASVHGADPLSPSPRSVAGITPNREVVDFYEATSALCRSADLDGADGLLSLTSCLLPWQRAALDVALAAEWKRQFMNPRLVDRVEADLRKRQDGPGGPSPVPATGNRRHPLAP